MAEKRSSGGAPEDRQCGADFGGGPSGHQSGGESGTQGSASFQAGKGGPQHDYRRGAGAALCAAADQCGLRPGHRHHRCGGPGQCADPGDLSGAAEYAGQCDGGLHHPHHPSFSFR